MDGKEQKIIEAAMEVIYRYGVKRTTMNDIAEASQMSRQSLYASYTSKNQLLRAIINYKSNKTLTDFQEKCCAADCLPTKLDILFECLAFAPRKTLDASPDAADIIIGFNEAAKEEIDAAGKRAAKEIEGILEPYKINIEKNGSTLPVLSSYIQQTLSSLKKDTQNCEKLEEHLSVLKTSILMIASD